MNHPAVKQRYGLDMIISQYTITVSENIDYEQPVKSVRVMLIVINGQYSKANFHYVVLSS